MANIAPKAHILESMQSQNIPWWTRISELIDNSFDASATRVQISFDNRALSVVDDGIGVANLLAVVTLGKHDSHRRRGLGRYGIGAKDAWLVTGDVIQIRSTHNGIERSLRVDRRELIKDNWECADPTEKHTGEQSGTSIMIPIKGASVPSWQNMSDRLGWVFRPALLEGKQIVFRSGSKTTPLAPRSLPAMTDVVSDSFAVGGRSVSIEIGIMKPGEKHMFGPFWVEYRHRMIKDSSIGAAGRAIGKLAGRIVLGEGWTLSKNKDSLIDNEDDLAFEIHERIKHLLTKCELEAEQFETDLLRMELESAFNQSIEAAQRESRISATRETGTVRSAFTGRKRRNASKISDNPGSVGAERQKPRRGFSIAFVEEESDLFGKFDTLGKTVVLNLLHTVIRQARDENNIQSLKSYASVIIANHQAGTDGGKQRLLACAQGDFLGAYVALISSIIKSEPVKEHQVV